MADLGAGITGVLVFVIVLVAAKQPLLLSAGLAAGAYLGVRLLLAPKNTTLEKPWLEPLALRWEGREEGERLQSLLRLVERTRQNPELTALVDEHLVFVTRACEPYKSGKSPTGQARTEFLSLLETIEARLVRLAETRRHADDKALADELIALRQTLEELVPERVIENRTQ